MDKTCCFIGHRTIEENEELKEQLLKTVERLICEQGVDTFLFGSKSGFDTLCLDLVSQIKERYPHIKRVYMRAEYPDIGEEYKRYLLQGYEDTFYPQKIRGAGKSVYVERNYQMIDSSRYCIFYYDIRCLPTNRKSGAEIALEYARRKKKEIICFP